MHIEKCRKELVTSFLISYATFADLIASFCKVQRPKIDLAFAYITLHALSVI
jgi:hypothetical protein